MSWNTRIVGSDMVDPSILCPNPKNWRRHPKYQQEAMTNVFNEIGWIQDIIVNKTTGNIIDGHMRAELAVKNKEKLVPVKYVELSEEEERQALITYDPLSALAEQDNETLKQLLGDISNSIDMSKFDFGKDVMNSMRPHTDEELDDVPLVPDTPTTKFGDIIQLGRHRLMCGDSTSKEDVGRLMDGKRADMVFTDPPYGISVVQGKTKKIGGGGSTKFKGKVGGGNIVNSREYSEIIGDESTDAAKNSLSVIADIKNKIIFGGNYFTDFLPASRCWIVWDKENTGNFADAELAWTSFDRGVKLYHWLWNGLSRKGSREEELKSRVHPTQKPVGLFKEILNDFSKDGEIILDPFLGSGTTLIACEQLNRICYGMEISPQYCDVIVNRWEKLTGKKAKLVGEVGE